MRVTVIVPDGVVCVDGVCYSGISMSGLPSTLHAMQWYGSDGEEEHIDPQTRRQTNIAIGELTPYDAVMSEWQAKHEAAQQSAAAAT